MMEKLPVTVREKLRRSKDLFRRVLAMGWSMRLRLFVFFMLLVATMLIGVVSLLMMMGIFPTGVDEKRRTLESELVWLTQNLEKQYGEISAQALRLSRHLSRNIENRLADDGFSVKDLSVRPDLLEKVLDGEYDTLFFSLERVRASGIFVVLNATVGRRERDLRFSRAGLYIKNWEPNILSETSPAILFLRGFSRIGQRHDVVLDAQWAMEFDVEGADYYFRPQKMAGEFPAFLRRLYYWQPAAVFRGTNYRAMLCSVPLVDSDGAVFGVCGFEVSDMLFRMAFMPASHIYNNIFCVLAPLEGQTLAISAGLLSWRYTAEGEPQSERELVVSNAPRGLSTYARRNGDVFMGLHRQVRLYAKDSPFASQNFVLALLAPRSDIDASVSERNRQLLSISLLLLALGIGCSFVFSKWFIRPVLRGLDAIRSGVSSPGAEITLRTNIPEIDDLIEFLCSQAEDPGRSAAGDETRPSEDGYEAFLRNVETLTPAERNVFDLYLGGQTAKEIAAALGLSVNTIKTHNKRIFMKLDVSSRRELLACVRKLQAAGRRIREA